MTKPNRTQVQKAGITLLTVFLPILIALVVAFIYGVITGESPLPVPKWNDEAAYYSLIKTFISYGQPLGYWGYDGNHALLGTGAAWGDAILLPYALFGRLFTWNIHSMYFANLFYLCLANMIFLYLTEPKSIEKIRLCIVQAASVITILYLSTCMSDVLRFAVAIIIAGVLYRLFFKESSKWFRYLIAPLILIGAVQVYIFFSFAVFLYVCAVMRKSKWWIRLITAVFGMGIVAGVSYYILHLISSNYDIGKTEILFDALTRFDILGAVTAFFRLLKDGISGLLYIMLDVYQGHGIFCWLVLFSFALFLGSLIMAIQNRRKAAYMEDHGNRDFVIGISICYSVFLFLFMYVTVYSLDHFTLLRGMGMVLLFSVYLLVFTHNQKIRTGLLLLYGVGILFLIPNLNDFMEDRYQTKAVADEWGNLAESFDGVMTLTKSTDMERSDSNRWSNTVAIFTLEPKVVAAIPAGFGINMIRLSDVFPEDAGYLIFSIRPEKELRSDWLEHDFTVIQDQYGAWLEEHYHVIYEDDNYVMYERNNS